jgi:flagellar hook-length control protein FliK
LSEATGVPRNTVSKQESVGTYRQVSISELPSVVLSALRYSGSREKLVRINLVPENLGPLTIKVKEIKDKLVIHFIASSANAKDILEVSMPQLKQSISQLSGSMDETLVFLSQEQGQGQGQNNHAQGGWNYYNNSLTRLLNDPVDDVQQTFENGINSQGVTRAVNYWV